MSRVSGIQAKAGCDEAQMREDCEEEGGRGEEQVNRGRKEGKRETQFAKNNSSSCSGGVWKRTLYRSLNALRQGYSDAGRFPDKVVEEEDKDEEDEGQDASGVADDTPQNAWQRSFTDAGRSNESEDAELDG